MNANYFNDNEKYIDRVLDSKLAQSLIIREAPNDVIVNSEGITRIGNLCDVSFLRKLNISLNPIASVEGVDQLPQLRELYAYACKIKNIECLGANTKLEILLIQSNLITKIPKNFLNLVKLQELRLDKNRIKKIENLNKCLNLRKLDLSWNELSDLDGLVGLHSLQELNVGNNSIKSLQNLKGFPSIKELDISYNQLKTLDGLQNIPTLEILQADHNKITHLKISGLGVKKSNNISSKDSDILKKAQQLQKLNSKSDKTTSLPELLSIQLSELYLSGNRIKSIEGLDQYGENIQTLDLSNNSISDLYQHTYPILSKFSELSELRIYNNPCCENTDEMNQFVTQISGACRSIKAIDGLSIILNPEYENYSRNFEAKLYSGKDEMVEFYTWEEDGSSIPDNNPRSTILEPEGEKDNQVKSYIIESDSEEEKEAEHSINSDFPPKKSDLENKSELEKLQDEIENADIGNKMYIPKLALKSMLSEEQIREKEGNFKNILERCKNIMSKSVFLFSEFNDKSMNENSSQITLNDDQYIPQHPKTTTNSAGENIIQKIDSAYQKFQSLTECESKINSTDSIYPLASSNPDNSINHSSDMNKKNPTTQRASLVNRVRSVVENSVFSFGKDHFSESSLTNKIQMPKEKLISPNYDSLVPSKPAERVQKKPKAQPEQIDEPQGLSSRLTRNGSKVNSSYKYNKGFSRSSDLIEKKEGVLDDILLNYKITKATKDTIIQTNDTFQIESNVIGSPISIQSESVHPFNDENDLTSQAKFNVKSDKKSTQSPNLSSKIGFIGFDARNSSHLDETDTIEKNKSANENVTGVSLNLSQLGRRNSEPLNSSNLNSSSVVRSQSSIQITSGNSKATLEQRVKVLESPRATTISGKNSSVVRLKSNELYQTGSSVAQNQIYKARKNFKIPNSATSLK